MLNDTVVENTDESRVHWRPMGAQDLDAVNAIADTVHAAHPEDGSIFAERLELYARGCQVLANGDRLIGYLISHPWYHKVLPSLNAMLGGVPATPNAEAIYFIHDIALLPAARNQGHGLALIQAVVSKALEGGWPRVGLVAIGGTVPFWLKAGFVVVDDGSLADQLETYDQAAVYMEYQG